MMKWQRDPSRLWNPYVSGCLLGLVLFSSIFITGHGLGVSGGLGRFVAYCEQCVAPAYVDGNPFLARMALSMV